MGIIKAFKLGFDYLKYDEDGNVEATQRAVNDVNLDIEAGDFVAVLGHNGSGKSTLAKQINALLIPSEGTMWVDDMDTAKEPELWKIRQKAGMVFQNPDNQIIGTVVEEDVGFGPENMGVPTDEIWKRVDDSLKKTGMTAYRYQSPNKLSGGQKQRIGIARALALEPDIIICDEAVSALDVSVQAQVLNLLQELKEKLGLTYFFISHNLNVVYQVSDRVGVMYLGKMVEIANYDQLYEKRYHPYTEALLSAIPQVGEGSVKRIHLEGEVPSPSNPPTGCRFHTRCPYATEACRKTVPELREVEGRLVACHFPLTEAQ